MTRTRTAKLALPFVVLAGLALFQAGNAAAAGPIGVVCANGPSFDLQATSGHIQTPDGNSVFMWSYAPNAGPFQAPGPILCVNQGDIVSVTLHNNLPEPVSIVFPGQTGVAASGGDPGLFTRVAPTGGGTVTYTFTAGEPGTYLYESGTNPHKQIEMGLYGALIVRPAMGANYAYNDAASKFDPAREYLLLLHDIDPALHAAVEGGGTFDITAKHDRYYTVNGRMFPDTIADNGVQWLPDQPYGAMVQVYPFDATANPDPALIRYANAGLSNHPMHPHGNHLRVIARDGRLLRGPGGEDTSYENFTRTVGSGQTYDLLFKWTDAERWRPTTNPVPVTIPSNRNLVFKDSLTWYSGSPYLGYKGSLPAGVTSNNRCGEYYFPWHSHALNEFVNFNEGFGGMATLLRVGKDFTISATPLSRFVVRPGATTYTVTVARTQCFSGFPTLSASGLPAGATASFSALSGSGAAGTSSTSTLTITTTSGTPTGASALTIRATSGPIVDTNTVTLNVLAALAPGSVAVAQGSAVGGSFTNLAANDGSYYQVQSQTTGGTRSATWCAAFSGVAANPAGLAVTYDGSNTVPRTQTVWIRNWTVSPSQACPTADNAWVQLNSRSVGSADTLIPGPTANDFILAPAPLTRFVNGSGQVTVRIRSTGGGSTTFTSRGDWLRLGHG